MTSKPEIPACEFGLEELVSQHRDRSGRQKHWIKVKNPGRRPPH
jgi:hypothetical protein